MAFWNRIGLIALIVSLSLQASFAAETRSAPASSERPIASGPKILMEDEAPPADDAAKLQWLLQKRRDVLRVSVEVTRAKFEERKAIGWLLTTLERERELTSAELEFCRTREARIAAHEKLVELAANVEQSVEAAYRAGTTRGVADYHARAKVYRIESEIGLLREQLGAEQDAAAKEKLSARIHSLLLERRDTWRLHEKETRFFWEQSPGYALFVAKNRSEAELEACRTPGERIVALEQSVKSAAELEKLIRSKPSVESKDMTAALAAADRCEAEVALQRERLAGAREAAAKAAMESKFKAKLAEWRDAKDRLMVAIASEYEGGVPIVAPVLDAISGLVKAQLELARASGEPPVVREKYLKGAVEGLLLIEKSARAKYVAGARGGSDWVLAQAKAARLAAEITLVGERLKQ